MVVLLVASSTPGSASSTSSASSTPGGTSTSSAMSTKVAVGVALGQSFFLSTTARNRGLPDTSGTYKKTRLQFLSGAGLKAARSNWRRPKSCSTKRRECSLEPAQASKLLA